MPIFIHISYPIHSQPFYYLNLFAVAVKSFFVATVDFCSSFLST